MNVHNSSFEKRKNVDELCSNDVEDIRKIAGWIEPFLIQAISIIAHENHELHHTTARPDGKQKIIAIAIIKQRTIFLIDYLSPYFFSDVIRPWDTNCKSVFIIQFTAYRGTPTKKRDDQPG
ncbi:hypothetical protein RF679_16435 [Undibacterium cyanobacteriorum]|uniref:Uncharacterized protein n=1 Tax=Undibacterium cyanobacteriorum TaxID=3073561 RepID=A0ABY9RHT1_9BURK|nr:hypothetical protein [Undibacterium sp. 20NA77.5]WMW80220.1 hypothetical protein RF679_16435 [Undibacterium sp. 20NA77.5]